MSEVNIPVLNTSNAKTRDQALNIIVKQMTNSSLYIPIAYMLGNSSCSCCLSEYFDIICKVKNEYKFLHYDGYIKHKNDCAIIRCSCGEPFVWKNIYPVEKNYEDYINISETFTPVKDDSWYYDFEYFYEQLEENRNIDKYNEDDDDDETNTVEKNYAFYFSYISELSQLTNT